MSQFFPVDELVRLAIMGVVVAAMVGLMFWYGKRGGEWKYRAVIILAVFNILVSLAGCGDTINPVRYQTQPVLVVKPCFAGRTPPAEAATLTTTTCDANGDCAVTCSDPRPEACVTHATADILELQREARQYRNLFRECSK